ncbi:MAG: TonB-dependent receptor [Paludibacteraceae bacterium]
MLSKGYKFFRSIFFILLIISGNGYAQQAKSGRIVIDSLKEVTIIENKKAKETRSISPLQQINSQSFTQLNLLQVSDAVKYLSGVTVKDYGGIGGLKTVSVRGLGANHTAVSYDGIRVSDMQTGQIDLSKFSTENVEYISLNNGQGDVIFQPATLFASASVLNIKTLTPKFEGDKKTNAKIHIKYGSFGLFSPTFVINRKISQTYTISLNGELISAKGNYPFQLNKNIEGNDSIKRRKNSDVENFHLEGTLHSRFSENKNGYIKLLYYHSERGLPPAIVSYNPTAYSSQRLWERNLIAQSHFISKTSHLFDIQINAKYNRDYLRYLDPEVLNTDGTTENTYIQQEIYGSLSTAYKPTEQLSFSVSSDISTCDLSADKLNFAYPARTSWLSVLSGKYTSEYLNLLASLLYTATDDNVKRGKALENQYKFSPYAGLSVKPLKKIDFRIRTFYKNIFRMPTFNDLYYFSIGERNLKPENTDQLNLGATYSFSTNRVSFFSITADAYHNAIKNKIVAFPNTNLMILTMKNYGKVEINGIDITTHCQLKLTDSIRLTLNNSYTYQQAVDKTNPTSGTYNNQLPYTPRISGAGSALLDLNFLTISYSIIWSGKRYAWFQNLASNRLDSYSDHHFSISKQIRLTSCVIETSFQCLNIWNKNYEIVKNFPMPGRNFRININIKI